MTGLPYSTVPFTPPYAAPTEARPVSDVVTAPMFNLYDPNSLRFGRSEIPLVPGGPVTMGLMQPVYDGQPCWDRGGGLAGPVRAFFRGVLAARSRVRQV